MLEVSAALEGVCDLLLENGVLLGIDIKDHLVRVVLQNSLELLVFLLAPFIKFLLGLLGICFSLLTFLVGGAGRFIGADIVETIHVSLRLLHHIFVVLALQDALVGTKDALQLSDLVVQLIGFFVIVRTVVFVVISEQLILVGVLTTDKFLNLNQVFLKAILKVLNLRQLQVGLLLVLLLALAKSLGVSIHLHVELLVVIVLATHVAEGKRLRLSVDRDDCFLVLRVGTLNRAVVLLLIVDLWQVLLSPVTFDDVTDDDYRDKDEDAAANEHSEEHVPIRWLHHVSH